MKKLCAILLLCGVSVFGQTAKTKYLTFQEVRPILESLKSSFPLELQDVRNESQWSSWVKKSDASIRKRLELGDEDSIVNQFLFGNSFTKQPRLTENEINQIASESSKDAVKLYEEVLRDRLEDYAKAVVSPVDNERMSYARDYFRKKIKLDLDTPSGKTEIKKVIVASLVRAINEARDYTSIIEQTRNNQNEDFLARSAVYKSRGLSSDTSLKPNFAIENAIKQAKEKGLINSATKIAIVGPGLDFTDKDQGYDFYPPQSIQPFAVIDSLLKLKLATNTKIRIDTYDLSPKVNSHISGISKRAITTDVYKIQLPLISDTDWSSDFLTYWNNFGNFIGRDTPPISVPENLKDLKLRAVSVNSSYFTKIKPFDANIVVQSPQLLEKDKYELIIGTNIFVYYGEFEKALIMKNIDKMLRKGGLLFSNDALTEIQSTKLRKVGQTATFYSDKKVDADLVVWYRKPAT
jgi:hypothetical protein